LETPDRAASSSLLAGLIDTFDLLTAQARAYERALPSDNYPARAAVAALGELARQALAEARDVQATLEPPAPAAHPLSPRELQVLTLAAEGLTNVTVQWGSHLYHEATKTQRTFSKTWSTIKKLGVFVSWW
jgi:ATP/maltotriose-dependent transcriptional regulator MalT